jgi:hypothetical protein
VPSAIGTHAFVTSSCLYRNFTDATRKTTPMASASNLSAWTCSHSAAVRLQSTGRHGNRHLVRSAGHRGASGLAAAERGGDVRADEARARPGGGGGAAWASPPQINVSSLHLLRAQLKPRCGGGAQRARSLFHLY